MLTLLSPEMTTENGIKIQMKVNDQGAPFVCLSGGELAPLLQLGNIASADFLSSVNGLQKLSQFFGSVSTMVEKMGQLNS